MERTKRQEDILEKLIEEYVKTAEPVSSGTLAKKHDFGVKPAMLRIEMEKLEKAGYLSQPFVSAGRVPTDKAYRFFVNNLLQNKRQGRASTSTRTRSGISPIRKKSATHNMPICGLLMSARRATFCRRTRR